MDNMSYEIIEAIESYYKNDEDMIADCMVWITDNKTLLIVEADDWLYKHDRCLYCGSKLKQRAYKETHNEIGNGAYETLYEWYCPECGKDVD